MKAITTIVLLHAIGCAAQTSNTGDFSILSGTTVSVVDNFTNNTSGIMVNDGALYLNNNLRNDGVFNTTFGSSTGLVYLAGGNEQFVSGDNPCIINNLTIDNASANGVNLQNTFRINGETNFQEGVVFVDPNLGAVIFENNAIQQSAWNGSHVEGETHKNGENTFVFPTGQNGAYRPLEMSAPSLATDGFSCEYSMQNSGLIYAHTEVTGMVEQISDTEYWTLNRETGSSNVIVGISYEFGITPSFITDDLENVHVVRWDETFNAWVSEGGVHDAANGMIYTVAEVNDFGIYTLAKVNTEANTGEEVVVYNLLTPDGNGENDWMVFDGLENFEDNQVSIVNRWGETVFELKGYDNVSNVFEGYANRGITNMNAPLPDGTYYYVVTYTNNSGEPVKKVGFIHLSAN